MAYSRFIWKKWKHCTGNAFLLFPHKPTESFYCFFVSGENNVTMQFTKQIIPFVLIIHTTFTESFLILNKMFKILFQGAFAISILSQLPVILFFFLKMVYNYVHVDSISSVAYLSIHLYYVLYLVYKGICDNHKLTS